MGCQRGKLPINLVKAEEPKRLRGSGQKARGWMWGYSVPPSVGRNPPGDREALTGPLLLSAERGKPDGLLVSVPTKTTARLPKAQRVKEAGGSEGSSVMEEIGPLQAERPNLKGC